MVDLTPAGLRGYVVHGGHGVVTTAATLPRVVGILKRPATAGHHRPSPMAARMVR
jgi:hypothetical protein